MSSSKYATGLLVAAVRLRAGTSSRPRIVALTATIALLATGGSAVYLSAPRPACSAPQEVLSDIPGSAFDAIGPLPARVNSAVQAIKQQSGFEGAWVEHGTVFVGVYGPTWDRAHAAATAVRTVPGPRITYVCQPATNRQLLATQASLDRIAPEKRSVLGSGVDVKTATVTVAVKASAPKATEAAFARAFGRLVKVQRLQGAYVEMGPAHGRMPLAQDIPQ